jgi:mannosyltransferase OCH1-like enzyme
VKKKSVPARSEKKHSFVHLRCGRRENESEEDAAHREIDTERGERHTETQRERERERERRARERCVHTRVEKWDFCIWTNGNESTLNNSQVTRHVRFIVKNLLLLLLLCTDLFSSFYFWWGSGSLESGWVGG